MQLINIDNELHVKETRKLKVCSSLEELNGIDINKYYGLFIDKELTFHWKR